MYVCIYTPTHVQSLNYIPPFHLNGNVKSITNIPWWLLLWFLSASIWRPQESPLAVFSKACTYCIYSSRWEHHNKLYTYDLRDSGIHCPKLWNKTEKLFLMACYQNIRRIDSLPDWFQKEVFYMTEASASAALGHCGETGILTKRKRVETYWENYS